MLSRNILNSIGDAVMSTDVAGRVTYLNAVAESITGWSQAEAAGHPLEEVFRVIDASTRAAVPNPLAIAILQNKVVHLAPNCVLIRRDGGEVAIDDCASPIYSHRGRVSGAVVVFRDVTTARAQSLKTSYLAQHDGLTALPNRALLNDRLNQAMALAQRHGKELALLFLDLDDFKRINDSLGHAVGDRLLQSVAQRLLACVRSSDTVSRQGGDEFVVLLSELERAKDAAVLAAKMLVMLERPHRIQQLDLRLTASIGIATYPDDGTETETLLKNADVAMYRAKHRGPNNYQFFRPGMQMHAVERQDLALRRPEEADLKTGATN